MVTKSVSPDEWQRRNAFDQNLQESATTIIITVFFTSNGIGIVSLADKQGPTQTHTNTTFWPNCSLVESQVFPAEPPIAEQRHYHLHWAQTRTHTVYTHQKKKNKKHESTGEFPPPQQQRSVGWVEIMLTAQTTAAAARRRRDDFGKWYACAGMMCRTRAQESSCVERRAQHRSYVKMVFYHG